MRYGLISDIHGNLEALTAVLDAMSKEGIDKYLCIGDVVGYGADPVRCIDVIRSLKPEALIAGNHDWGVLGLVDLEYFNDAAAEAIRWTRSVLGAKELNFLKSFKLIYKERAYSLVHGSLVEPERFYYILTSCDAYESMEVMKTNICFVGHSHAAGIFCSNDDTASEVQGRAVKVVNDKKYVVNVGSVGQPRDHDPRAAFAIYDESRSTVEIKRVKYNIKSAQEKILSAGLPEMLAIRLGEGR